MTPTAGQALGLVIRNVLKRPATLAIWVGAVAFSFIFESFWPLLLGVVAQAGLVWFFLQDDSRTQQALQEERRRQREQEEIELAETINFLDAESRFRLRSITQLRREITEMIEEPGDAAYALSTLRSSLPQVDLLVEKAIGLAKKRRELETYLSRIDEQAITRYIDELRRKTEAATDPVVRSQYQQSLNAKTQELEDSRAIRQTAQRIDGQIESIDCAFAGMKARIIRLKTAEMSQVQTEWEQLGSELNTLTTDVDTLEKSVNETLAI